MSDRLKSTFESFCSFGAGKGGEALMDNAKFAKFCRDTKILDRKLTSTDVDIIFNKVKAKSERKINCQVFTEALEQLAQIKYPKDKDGYDKLVALVLAAKGPKTVGVTAAQTSGAVDRLTDTSKYTGTHKERFDESGKGRGMEGREPGMKGSGMASGSVGGMEGYVHGYKHAGTYDKKASK